VVAGALVVACAAMTLLAMGRAPAYPAGPAASRTTPVDNGRAHAHDGAGDDPMTRGAAATRTSVAVVLAAVVLLLVLPTSGHARRWHGHGDVFVGVGPAWWGPTYPGWYYPPPAYVVTPPPVVIRDEPQEYVERESDEPDEPERS
jgi:hypothetical protein